MLSASDFFNLANTNHSGLFDGTRYVWDAIPKIHDYIIERLSTDLRPNLEHHKLEDGITVRSSMVYIGENVTIEPGAYIEGPAIIGNNCEIRNGAYLRADVILDDGVVIGHTSELKNVV